MPVGITESQQHRSSRDFLCLLLRGTILTQGTTQRNGTREETLCQSCIDYAGIIQAFVVNDIKAALHEMFLRSGVIQRKMPQTISNSSTLWINLFMAQNHNFAISQVKLITHARVLIGSTDQEENTAISFSPRLEGTTERQSRHVSLMSCRS